MVPDVHHSLAFVARLIAADVTEKGLEVMECASAVPETPQLATDVVEGQRVDPLTGRRMEGVQF